MKKSCDFFYSGACFLNYVGKGSQGCNVVENGQCQKRGAQEIAEGLSNDQPTAASVNAGK